MRLDDDEMSGQLGLGVNERVGRIVIGRSRLHNVTEREYGLSQSGRQLDKCFIVNAMMNGHDI